MIATFFLTLTLIFAPTHDMSVAIYELEVQEAKILMEATFDKENMEEAIRKEYAEEASPNLVASYLSKHSSWIANKKRLDINTLSVTHDHQFYTLKAELPFTSEALSTFQIRNTCLFAEVEDHSNIVFINYKGKEKIYKLTAKRSGILVEW
ncbi:MAG: DUF6702 family protein [Bacteroidota bacterium]